jgi:exosortase A-associated hydrolase 1
MNIEERALCFSCHDSSLYGIVSLPEKTIARGVLIVVGGPQYRVGSHRQFTLLARALASQGIPAMRFDYRGMGDSEGDARNFEAVSDDIRAAIDQFVAAVPGMNEVAIWGLCDAASAALFYAGNDQRVTGLVLLNPWVRTSGSIAKTTLKHYYLARFLQADLWRKIVSGKFNYVATVKSFFKLVGSAFAGGKDSIGNENGAMSNPVQHEASLPDRMLSSFNRFTGKVLLIVSGADLTAQEFVDMVGASRKWQRALTDSRVTQKKLAEADHTFSSRIWRDQVSNWTSEWVRTW